jgi:GH43 family beta-xylosidase
MMRYVFILFSAICLAACNDSPKNSESIRSETVTNPILNKGADPWVIKEDSIFHYCYSKGNALHVKSVTRISELEASEVHTIWQAPDSGLYSREIWAPELHHIDGKWYVYFAADDGENKNHRMHMLVSEAPEPHTGFSYVGKISDSSDKWAIDGTTFTYAGKRYFAWSGWEGEVNVAQHLYIAEMGSPTTIISERVKISSPEYEWEKRGSSDELPTINEGPEVIQKDGKLVIIYSASGSWSDDYCLGMLALTGNDPMNPTSWVKNDKPVFSGTEKVISPGHASFVASGGQDYIVYHAIPTKGGGWDSRQVRIQPFFWKAGLPDFGKPLADETEVEIFY